MLSASLDWAAMHLAATVRDVAAALVLEEEPGPIGGFKAALGRQGRSGEEAGYATWPA